MTDDSDSITLVDSKVDSLEDGERPEGPVNLIEPYEFPGHSLRVRRPYK